MSEPISPLSRVAMSSMAVDYKRTDRIAGPDITSETKIRDAKLKKATEDFESLFLYNLLKKMRATVPRSAESNFGMQTMREITDEQLAGFLARQGGIGLGDQLYASLQCTRSASAEDESSDGSNPTPTGLSPAHHLKPLNTWNSVEPSPPLSPSTTDDKQDNNSE